MESIGPIVGKDPIIVFKTGNNIKKIVESSEYRNNKENIKMGTKRCGTCGQCQYINEDKSVKLDNIMKSIWKFRSGYNVHYFAPRYGTVGRLTESKPQAVSYSASNQIPAVYSPVYDRRVFTVTRDYVSPFPENELCQGDQEGASLTVFQEKEDEKGSTTERVESPKEQVGEGSPAGVPEESPIPECSQTQITPKLNGPKLNSRRSPTYRFQFLEQKYGYFHCKECSTRWESAYVWCISGTNKVYFKQLCRKCMKGYNPYRVEAIQCQTCSKTQCSCPRKKRHIDLKKPHRQELCGRCKGKSLSCDNTYSFNYIV
ncbi:zygote arrest protein 1-like [Protopterus annectens]|uniref:zygote arrest protein 1-like n=1 Tax=Protopterus annectens TaxID=7888 RepID=UPI001CFAAC70|nr:zygote arrest protein 1-like [Protopterus annectens]